MTPCIDVEIISEYSLVSALLNGVEKGKKHVFALITDSDAESAVPSDVPEGDTLAEWIAHTAGIEVDENYISDVPINTALVFLVPQVIRALVGVALHEKQEPADMHWFCSWFPVIKTCKRLEAPDWDRLVSLSVLGGLLFTS